MNPEESKVLFIMNPNAGRNNADKSILSIHNRVATQPFDFKFVYTRGEGDDERIKSQINDYKPDRIVACGGDGTLQLVARSLVGFDIPMGILPIGSANGFARAMNIPADIEEALNIVLHSTKVKRTDMLKFNDEHWCIHLSDIGTNALLVKNYHEAGDKGMIGYAKHLMAAINQSESMNYSIKTPSETVEKTGVMVAFANAHKYGTGVQISEGSVSDGKFEINNVQKIDLESTIKAGLTALNVFIDKDMFSDVISCESAEIVIDRKVHWQVDGEYLGEIDRLKIEVVPAAIRLLI
jgi:YegS/Rv2252/BmrU family lipid kinase